MFKEMKINKYLTVKLIDREVYTYVNNERFLQCRHALMSIPTENLEDYEGFDSIDDIIEYSRKRGHYHGAYNQLSPEIEYMVHCSNLQAWVETNYDTRILHSNLSFPLLQKIAEFDSRAKIA